MLSGSMLRSTQSCWPPSDLHGHACLPLTLLRPARSGAFASSHPRRRHSQSRARPVQRFAASSSSESSTDSTEAEPETHLGTHQSTEAARPPKRSQRRQADSTDWISSQLTRRFGLAGGLAYLGFLTFGVVSEQIKTRLEVAADERGTRDVENAQEVTLPSGVTYTDLRIGGGQMASRGLLIILDLKLWADGELIQDTKVRGKPIVFIVGGRPFTGGMTAGAEEALSSMKAGGRRRVVVPPALGFGPSGGVLRPTEHVPDKEGVIGPNALLTYELELQRVSIPPS